MSLAEATRIAALAAVDCVSDPETRVAMTRLVSAIEAMTTWNVALCESFARERAEWEALEQRLSRIEAFLVLQ